jgi:hypothetical protein
LSLTDFERRAKKTCKNCRTFLFEKKSFLKLLKEKSVIDSSNSIKAVCL